MEQIKYNIDEFIVVNANITIKGWIFRPYMQLEALGFVFSKGTEECVVPVENIYEREDVIAAFGDSASLCSGFSFEGILPYILDYKIYLQYQYEGEIKRVLVKENHESLIKYLVFKQDLISKKNFFKLLTYIKRKDLKGLIKKIQIVNHKNEMNALRLIDFFDWIGKNVICNEKKEYRDEFLWEADVIIPVYNGLGYLERLFKNINKTNVKLNLIVIDDKSDDQRVVEYLDQLSILKQITLLRNDKNLGFVKSVNRGLRLAKKHVILLNTDTEVPSFWAERLLTPIIKNENIASVTPFTNAGTICSFPNIGVDNKIVFGFSVSTVDEIFQRIKPRYTEIPTGVGFCMAMNQKAIEEVGLLDECAFLRGYGEENDWCQRAILKGYKNIISENLFVFHNHGGSFTSIEKKILSEKGMEIIKYRYPNYLTEVADFMGRDSIKDIRQFVYWMLICKASKEVSLCFDSYSDSLGRVEQAFTESTLSKEDTSIVLFYNKLTSNYQLEFKSKYLQFEYTLENLDRILDLGSLFAVNIICIKRLEGFPNVYDIMQKILDMKLRLNAQLVTHSYDYFVICPTSNFIVNNKYCGGTYKECERCFRGKNLRLYNNIMEWQERWTNILNNSDLIITSGPQIKERLCSIYNLQNISLSMDTKDFFVECVERKKFTSSINIGIIDNLNLANGLYIIKQMLDIISKNNLNIKIFLFGKCDENIVDENFKQINIKFECEIENQLLKNDINIIFQASIFPKDIGFKLKLAKAMKIPIAAFNFNETSNQMKSYSKNVIVKAIDAEMAVNTILDYESSDLEFEQKIYKILFVIEKEDFASRYRVDHLVERLNSQGVYCEYILRRRINSISAMDYTTVIFYRTPYSNDLINFINNARSQKCRIIFDVDDYIFDFKEISHLDFLQDKEYINFESYCNQINLAMGCCDAIMTSTLELQFLIQQKYKKKKCFVNRNSVSTTMVLLSKKAIKQVDRDPEKIVMGYFSGSKTHDQDFAEIAATLIKIMKENKNVHLKVVGCLDLPKEFDCIKDRIIKMDFLHWTDLPSTIASVDINLMPLKNNNFTVCKSENKWVEAALVKVPTILSYNSELIKVVSDKQNAIVCKKKEDWDTSLKLLIDNPKLRHSIAIKANQYVMKNYISVNRDSKAKEFLLETNLEQ